MTVSITGTITSTTRDKRSAIVKLDEPVDGKRLAVITPETKGRLSLMNGVGELKPNVRVRGDAKMGIDALNVVEVSIVR